MSEFDVVVITFAFAVAYRLINKICCIIIKKNDILNEESLKIAYSQKYLLRAKTRINCNN